MTRRADRIAAMKLAFASGAAVLAATVYVHGQAIAVDGALPA